MRYPFNIDQWCRQLPETPAGERPPCHRIGSLTRRDTPLILASVPLSYTITGGAARHEKVKPKTWRIFTFADDNWYHHHGYWYHQLPLTRLISEPATIFTPPWFFQNNFRCFLFFCPFFSKHLLFWVFSIFFRSLATWPKM